MPLTADDRRVWFQRHARPGFKDWQTYAADLERRIEDLVARMRVRSAQLGDSISSTSISTAGLAQPHDLTHSPLILWQFDESAADSSGNGFDQAWTSGTERYTELAPGLRGAFFDGASGMTRAYNATIAAALIADDWTVEFLGRIPWSTALQAVFTHGVTGETEATNVLASWSLTANGGCEAVHETGAGVNSTHTIAGVYNNGALFHGALRKSSGVYQFFINGTPFGAASTAFSAPSGGTSGTFNVGIGISVNQLTGAIASMKFCTRDLTDEEIKAEYNRTLGPFYGALA